ncbi:MAG: glycosyltransferase 87 family protein, partial [Thermomicrobiales bacterium]
YTESLFVLLVVGTLMLASKNRWLAAGLVAGLATGTRLVGLALIPALLLLAYKRKASLLDVVTSIGLSCYGVLAFGVYSAFETGNPFEYFSAQSEWGGWSEHVRRYAELFLKHPRETINGDPLNLVILFNVILLIVALAWLPSVWRRTDPGVALFTTLIVVIQGAMTWVSLGRYLLPAIGVYFVAGRWLADPKRSPWTREWVTAASAIAITTLTILFAHGFWVI